jgi:hypothetical protein
MTDVFILWHWGSGSKDREDDDAMLLGVFSSEEKAREWQDAASSLPGFRDWPERFQIAAHTLDERKWQSGFATWRDGNWVEAKESTER